MIEKQHPGLGELLRYLSDLLDKGSEAHYRSSGLSYRARYTPILRRLDEKPATINILQKHLKITQGAISQTVKLMESEGLIKRIATQDGRSQMVELTSRGKKLRKKLDEFWTIRLEVIEDIEKEIGAPVRLVLTQVIEALENRSFDTRIKSKEDDRKK